MKTRAFYIGRTVSGAAIKYEATFDGDAPEGLLVENTWCVRMLSMEVGTPGVRRVMVVGKRAPSWDGLKRFVRDFSNHCALNRKVAS